VVLEGHQAPLAAVEARQVFLALVVQALVPLLTELGDLVVVAAPAAAPEGTEFFQPEQ
jgi:hypothetical protein